MLADRRVKIVATIGPSINTKENLEKAIRAGMNVARLNFSHGTQEDHLKVIHMIRELADKLKAPVTILQDLQGPKIRVGRFENGKIEIKTGEIVTITIKDILGKPGLLPSDFKELPQSCDVGTKILLDDGLLELKVTKVGKEEVEAEVIFGGILKDRKGMNIPGGRLPVECMTEKDLSDLEFGIKHNVDYIALSFVRHAKDIRKLREIIESRNSSARIIAKIEMLEALENLEEIVRLSDAVMVARGDLAVEVGQTQLPGLQKKIIKLCNQLGRPVITATQMLDSMIENPRPTRAEITDIANAVLDGSDATMLSAESASGKYPFHAIATMNDIILEVEKSESRYYKINLDNEYLSVASAVAASASLTALKVHATAIVCLTTTGKTAAIISGYRPKAKIIAVTDKFEALSKLELVWGIQTIPIKSYSHFTEVLEQIESILIEYGLVKVGDKIILTHGVPIKGGAKTNSLFVHTIQSLGHNKLSQSSLPLRYQDTH